MPRQRASHTGPWVALTLDIDWAPDFVIDFAAEQLIRRRVKATWFVTHPSPAVDRLREHPELFELGIHPNFLPGSTQGKTVAEVLAYCRRCVPEARSMRTHALVQSSSLLDEVMCQDWIERDVSLFLPYHPNLQPVLIRSGNRELWRIPYFWEDDDEMEQICPDWNLQRLLRQDAQLAVFDFHPMHVFLNSSNMKPYRALKRQAAALTEASCAVVNAFIQPDYGTRTAFAGLIEILAEGSWRAETISALPIAVRRSGAEGVAA